jgi:hypothetical protein
MSPVVGGLFDGSHADLIEAGVITEPVVERSLAERVRTEAPEGFARSLSYDGFELYVTGGAVPLGLAICGRETFLGGYDDDGRMRVCIASSPSLSDRAIDRYRRRREAATRVRAPEEVPAPGENENENGSSTGRAD